MSGKIISRLRPLAFIKCLVILCLILQCLTSARAQEPPITKVALLDSLTKDRKPYDWYIDQIKKSGVDFELTKQDEARIGQVGSYLGNDRVKDLIAAIRSGRLRVLLLQYAACGQNAETFQDSLSADFQILLEPLSRETEHKYIAGLRLKSENKSAAEMSLDEINYYRTKTKSLQVMSGKCSGDNRTVVSRVFLDGLPGSFITVQSKIETDAYEGTFDLHNLLLFYSLALDAQAMHKDKSVTLKYLGEAYKLATSCRFEKLPADDPTKKIVDNLKAAIIKMLVDDLRREKPEPSPCQQR